MTLRITAPLSLLCIAVIAQLAFIPLSRSFAQPVELPAGVPLIATSIREGETMIDGEDIAQFQQIVPPSLEYLVKKGGMPIAAVRALPFPEPKTMNLDALQGNFGSGKEGDSENDAKTILERSQSLWSSPPAFEASVSYYRYRASYDPAYLHFFLKRSYTNSIKPYPAGQYYRELVEFDLPSQLKPLQFLTIRFDNGSADRIWENTAPASVRPLESWLRHERAAGGLFVLDDLFVNSGSVDQYDFKGVNSATLLVPFSATTGSQFVADGEDCIKFSYDAGKPPFNTFSRRFVRALGWVPTDLVFVPRKVFVIKATPKSPYVEESEITVVVDKSSLLPVIKIVRNDSGGLLRVVLGGFSFGKTPSGETLPVVRQIVSISAGAKEVDGLSFDSIRRCGASTANGLRGVLDPKVLLNSPH